MRLIAAAAACALLAASCAVAIGLDDLEFDRDDGTGGSGGTGPSASGVSTSTSSAPSGSTGEGGAGPGSTGAGGATGSGGGPQPGAYPALIAATLDPTGYWRLGEAAVEDVALDAGPYGWHGTYNSGAGSILLGQPAAFSYETDTSATFAGGGRVVVSPSKSEYPFRFTGDVTYSVTAWVSYDASLGPQLALACYDGTVPSQGYILAVGESTSLVVAGLDAEGLPAQVGTEGFALPDAGWHFVAFAVDETDRLLHSYLNGVEVGAPVVPPIIQPHGGLLQLGYDDGADDSAATVALDEVMLEHFGLTAEQVAILERCGRAGDCAF